MIGVVLSFFFFSFFLKKKDIEIVKYCVRKNRCLWLVLLFQRNSAALSVESVEIIKMFSLQEGSHDKIMLVMKKGSFEPVLTSFVGHATL